MTRRTCRLRPYRTAPEFWRNSARHAAEPGRSAPIAARNLVLARYCRGRTGAASCCARSGRAGRSGTPVSVVQLPTPVRDAIEAWHRESGAERPKPIPGGDSRLHTTTGCQSGYDDTRTAKPTATESGGFAGVLSLRCRDRNHLLFGFVCGESCCNMLANMSMNVWKWATIN